MSNPIVRFLLIEAEDIDPLVLVASSVFEHGVEALLYGGEHFRAWTQDCNNIAVAPAQYVAETCQRCCPIRYCGPHVWCA